MERVQVELGIGHPLAVREADDKRRIVLPKEADAMGSRFIVYHVELPVELATGAKKYGLLLVPTEG